MALPPNPTKSSHIALRWLSLRYGAAAGTNMDALAHFATEMLRRYEQVDARTEIAREHRAIKTRDRSWFDIEKVETFLRNLRNNITIVRSLNEQHHFVLAVLPGKEGHSDEVVGVVQFKEGPKKKLVGQFTCVNPDFQRMRIGEKLHRAIQGFGRKYGHKIYEAELSSLASQRMYERMQRNPRVRVGKMPKQGVTERIEVKMPQKKSGIPSVRVKVFPLLRRRRKK